MLAADRHHRRPAADIVFDHVSFRYPTASEVSLASLESIALPVARAHRARLGVLHDVELHRAGPAADRPGRPVRRRQDDDHATWCPGCTTPRGTVRIGGFDLRDVTLESLHDAVGVVTQDAHLFHDTIRANSCTPGPTPPRTS